MDAPVIVQTPRLALREAVLPDAAFLLTLLTDPSWLENIGDRGVRTAADAERYISDTVRAPYQALGFGLYVIQLRSDALPIGLCGLLKRDFLAAPDLGFALLPDFVGSGYASEAARAVLSHARAKLGIERLYAIVQRSNRRSIRLLERLGFHHEGPCRTPQGEVLELYVTQLRA